MHLDLGQRDFGFASCAVCGMLYGKGLPEEERVHDQFHNAHAAAFKFPGWASERVVVRDGAHGRLLCVIPSDPKPQQRKVGEVCRQLEKALGLPQGCLLAPDPPYKVFFWVSGGGGGGGGTGGGGGGDRITGVLVAQLQERARWAQLTPAATPARPRQPKQQRDTGRGQHHSRGTVAGAAVAAAMPPATPAPTAAAAATVEVDPDGGGDVAAGDRADAAGRDGAGGPQQRALRAAPAAIGLAAADASGSASCSTSTVRHTGPVDGDPAAKRPRLQEMTHGSAAARCDDDAHSTGAAGAAGGMVTTRAEAAAEGPSAASWPPTVTAAASGPAASTAAPPPETPASARALPPRAPPQTQPPRCVSGGNSGGGNSGGGNSGGGGGGGDARARAVLGVRGLWVEPGWRRRGVATRLMDAARCCMVPGVAAERSAVAFSACAAAAASGDDDGGAAFTAFAASYLDGGGVGLVSGGEGGYSGQSAFSVLLYDDDE